MMQRTAAEDRRSPKSAAARNLDCVAARETIDALGSAEGGTTNSEMLLHFVLPRPTRQFWHRRAAPDSCSGARLGERLNLGSGRSAFSAGRSLCVRRRRRERPRGRWVSQARLERGRSAARRNPAAARSPPRQSGLDPRLLQRRSTALAVCNCARRSVAAAPPRSRPRLAVAGSLEWKRGVSRAAGSRSRAGRPLRRGGASAVRRAAECWARRTTKLNRLKALQTAESTPGRPRAQLHRLRSKCPCAEFSPLHSGTAGQGGQAAGVPRAARRCWNTQTHEMPRSDECEEQSASGVTHNVASPIFQMPLSSSVRERELWLDLTCASYLCRAVTHVYASD